MSNPDRSGRLDEEYADPLLEPEMFRSGDRLLERLKRFKADLKVSHDALIRALGNQDQTRRSRSTVRAAEMIRYDISVHSESLQSSCEEVLALGDRSRRGENDGIPPSSAALASSSK